LYAIDVQTLLKGTEAEIYTDLEQNAIMRKWTLQERKSVRAGQRRNRWADTFSIQQITGPIDDRLFG
jgi:hypothetical protein